MASLHTDREETRRAQQRARALDEDVWMSLFEAAAHARCSYRTIQRACKDGSLRHIRLGGRKAAHPCRPAPDSATVEGWDALLRDWVANASLPLYVRKSADNRGSVVVHQSGRELVPCDNSPALWAYSVACRTECPSLEEVRALIAADRIPVAFALKAGSERNTARYRAGLSICATPTTSGWKLGHLDAIGLNARGPLDRLPLDTLKAHFISFLSPRNQFVVPKEWAGLAELPEVIEAMRDWARATSPGANR